MAKHEPPKLVIFDCDGVLVDSEMIACQVTSRVLSELGTDISAKDCLARFTGISIALMKEMIDKNRAQPLTDNFAQLIQRADHLAFENELKPVTGIETALDLIASSVCVASSGSPEKIANSLRLTRLAGYFKENLFSAAMVANGKPAPDLFLLAAKKMAVSPKQCVVIEDSVFGVTAGVRAGMRVLGFCGASHAINDADYGDRLRAAGADTVFTDMTALPRLLGV